MKLTVRQVMDLITHEQAHQTHKYGSIELREIPIPGWIQIAQAELDEAKAGWLKNVPGRDASLQELIQVAAVCVSCIQQHGAEGNGQR